ncbi:hypothetical protein CAter10_2353 [Collimonas arenae]|nr:hypothetical protein CAter10_2353 [Collimonas arenae]
MISKYVLYGLRLAADQARDPRICLFSQFQSQAMARHFED